MNCRLDAKGRLDGGNLEEANQSATGENGARFGALIEPGIWLSTRYSVPPSDSV